MKKPNYPECGSDNFEKTSVVVETMVPLTERELGVVADFYVRVKSTDFVALARSMAA